MKATKYDVTVKVEVLDMNSVVGMLAKVICELDDEFANGKVTAVDGDTVGWKIETKEVSI